jgi:hypothetical protein
MELGAFLLSFLREKNERDPRHLLGGDTIYCPYCGQGQPPGTLTDSFIQCIRCWRKWDMHE